MTESQGPDRPVAADDTGAWDELLDAPVAAVDLDQDGVAEAVILDADRDSVPDTALIDTDSDGVADVAVVDLEAGGPAAPGQPADEGVQAGPGYQDPFADVEPHVDPSYEMPAALETADDETFNTAMQAEQDELDNLSTPLS